MFTKIFVLLGMAAAANAHVVMTNPVPFAGSNISPLSPDGSNFPCQGVSFSAGGGNTFEQGSNQELAFQGSAVHGGGSCQVSITTDVNPTKASVWKVIKSFEGGCPARDTSGNLPQNDATLKNPNAYDFDIPAELATGDYVLAWTWFNKIGNREMYMNCAPVTITGSGGDENFLGSLPDMFVANIGIGSCTTLESFDVKFPDAGSLTETNGSGPFGGISGCSGGSDPSSPVPEPSSPVSTVSSHPVPVPTATIPGGVFITVPTTGPTTVPTPEEPTPAPEEPTPTPEKPTPIPEEPTPTPEKPTPAPEEPTPTPEEPTPAPENPAPIPSDGSQFAAGTACATEGTWNCIGGSSFQRCASGAWSAVQGLASGMTCEGGQSDELKVNSSAGRRSMRRSLRIKA